MSKISRRPTRAARPTRGLPNVHLTPKPLKFKRLLKRRTYGPLQAFALSCPKVIKGERW